MRKWLLGIGACVLFGGSVLLWPQQLTEEEKVKLVILQVEQGAEAAKLGQVMEMISRDYQDENGLSQQMLRGFLFQQFRKRGPINLAVSPILLTLEDTKAEASFEVALVEREKKTLIGWPVDADLLHFEVKLRKEADEQWRIVSHTREKVIRRD